MPRYLGKCTIQVVVLFACLFCTLHGCVTLLLSLIQGRASLLRPGTQDDDDLDHQRDEAKGQWVTSQMRSFVKIYIPLLFNDAFSQLST